MDDPFGDNPYQAPRDDAWDFVEAEAVEEPVLATAVSPRPRHPGWTDLLIAVAIIWSFELFLGTILLLSSGFSLPQEPEMNVNALLALTVAANLFVLAVCWYFLCARYRKTVWEGFRLWRLHALTFSGCIVVGVALAGAATVLTAEYSTGESLMAELARQSFWAVAAMAVFVPAFEEVYYRGLVFSVLDRKLGAGAAIAITSLWFTAAHVPQLIGDWIGIPVILALALLLAIQRSVTGSLVAPIVTHWVYNASLIGISVILGET